MRYLIRSIMTGIVMAGLGLNLLTQWDGGQAEAAVLPMLTHEANSFANQCAQTLDAYDHDFAPSVSVADGCTCLAQEMSRSHASDLPAAGIVLTGIVAHPTDGAAREPDWQGIAARAGISDAHLGALLQSSYTAVGICGRI
ncbi:hypothetical protein SLH49_06870 [Cognatiyoonia sp. IB215446]|uniref:hypothetical protein n=1 Tax=Cognatiyoonia sp. IB215446 TaxID=3097355 RepID=UPI002A178F01|nr:hypothetical protein [Cognatiyoonia sp. IB215446]MDX8347704.1 hypothetical protein [Cognatiyoonia sp. IB215446]